MPKKIKPIKVCVACTCYIDPKYKWYAIQPWGKVMAYTRKPRAIHDRKMQDGNFIPYYWAVQSDELSITDHGWSSDWRNSLRRI